MEDIATDITRNVQERCQCGFVRDRVTDEVFRCFPASPQAVTYRAVLHGIASATSSELISHIELWTAEGAVIRIQQVLLEVDGSCDVAISSLKDEECLSPFNSVNPFNSAAIIGGTVAMAMLLLVFVAALVTAFLLCKKLKTQTTETSSQTKDRKQ